MEPVGHRLKLSYRSIISAVKYEVCWKLLEFCHQCLHFPRFPRWPRTAAVGTRPAQPSTAGPTTTVQQSSPMGPQWCQGTAIQWLLKPLHRASSSSRGSRSVFLFHFVTFSCKGVVMPNKMLKIKIQTWLELLDKVLPHFLISYLAALA